jgi:two-component system, NtrC family, response regulator
MASVLIIDDNVDICNILTDLISIFGHKTKSVHTISDGLKEAMFGDFDVVFLDVRLPDGCGLDILPQIKKSPTSPEVIIMTAFGDPDGAEIAIKHGVWDYLEKPLSRTNVIYPLEKILQYRDELKKVQKSEYKLKLEGIIGNSPAFKESLEALAHAAKSDANVLIYGETGTGKELFARAIHNNSSRTSHSFVIVDCAALPETLVESALLGYEKGAFTGAIRSQPGLVKQADGGTLFLDEVGELPMSIQKAFLRVLQEHRYRPIGGLKEINSNFRLVAATNRDLYKSAVSEQFKDALLYRLQTITIRIPPLRERLDDINDLTFFHVARLCKQYNFEEKGVSTDFLSALSSYHWPGNIRELVNILEWAITTASDKPTLYAKHLPVDIRIKKARNGVSQKDNQSMIDEKFESTEENFPKYRNFREILLLDAEKKYFQDLIVFTKGNINEACRVTGLGRTRLYTLLKKYGINRFDK